MFKNLKSDDKSHKKEHIPIINNLNPMVEESELKELQQNLIAIERKALGLFELTNGAIFFLDLEGNYIDVNQRAAEMLGYNRQDMIGKSKYNFLPKEEIESSKQKLTDLLAGRILPIYVRLFKKRDGTIFPAEINAAIVQDAEGQTTYIQSVVRDISERVKAEEAQLRERKVFNLVAEATIYSHSIADFCQRIIIGFTKILDFDASTIRIYDKETRMLVPIAQIDYTKEDFDPKVVSQSIDDPNFIFALAARNKQAIISSRFEDRCILAPFQDHLNKLGISSIITWPILGKDEELLGVIQLVSYKPKEIPEEDLLFFKTITRMFTVAVERKQAEEALRESEERYRSFTQNFQGIAYRTTTDWTPIFLNGAVSEITGYNDDEIIHFRLKWREIIHPDDKNHVLAIEQKLLSIPDYITQIEYRIIRKNNQICWIHEACQNINDEENKPIYINGVIYDITERKRNETIQEIQKTLGISLSSISDLKKALEIVLKSTNMIDVIECGCACLIEKESGFLSCVSSIGLIHDFIESITYYSSESTFTRAIMTGRPAYSDYNELILTMEKDLVEKGNLHSLAVLPIYSEEWIVAVLILGSKTSDTIPLSTRNALEMIVSQIEGAIKRIHIEVALRESDEKYRTFVKNFKGIAYRLNSELVPLFLDGAVEDITNYTSLELLSMENPREELLHPYDYPIVNKYIKASKESPNKIGKMEYRIITKTGQLRWVQDNWQVLIDEHNKAWSYQGSIHDITDKKQAQHELEKLYQDLEQRVVERTEQLSEANRELSAFSYSVSHDLRTPLRHIEGFAQLLEKRISSMDLIDERILVYTNKIISSIEEMNKLIDGLLTFSRVSRIDMVNIQINLTELVQDVLNDFQVELANREIDLKVNFLPEVVGDPSLLRLVIVNLLANALKFTKNKKVTEIEISTIPSKEPNKATIFIRDNGIGFDMKYYSKLFGVFQRLHKQEEFEGTGIGLATVQRVIRRMGGNVWAEGEVDNGATFYFSIPLTLESIDNND